MELKALPEAQVKMELRVNLVLPEKVGKTELLVKTVSPEHLEVQATTARMEPKVPRDLQETPGVLGKTGTLVKMDIQGNLAYQVLTVQMG